MSSRYGAFKIVLLGDTASKTILVYRYLTKIYDESVKMTIGVDFCVKDLEIDGKRVVLRIWDFGGEQRFKVLLPRFTKGADGALFIYDIANYASINNIDDWLSIIRRESRVEVPILLVGIVSNEKNKRQVSVEVGKEIAKSKNLNGFIECNLKTGKNVEKAFEALTRLILADTSYTSSQRKVEDLSLYCSKCKKLLTTEEFLKHPCFTTGAVSLRGDINRGFNYLTTKERRKKEKKKKRAKKERKIGERRRKEEYSTKDEEYLITYTRHLEKRLRNLETEKQLLDAERLRLEQEVNRLRNEIDRYKKNEEYQTPIKMKKYEEFIVYDIENTGDRTKLNITSEELRNHLNPKKVLIIICNHLKRIYIWKGAKSHVRKKFISSRIAQDLQRKLIQDPMYNRCKIISIDQGRELQEFINAFRLESMEATDTLPDMRYPRNFDRNKKDFKFLEEKINAFGDLVEKMMSVIFRIPDLVDQSLATVNQKLSTLESRINGTSTQKPTTTTKDGDQPTSPSSGGSKVFLSDQDKNFIIQSIKNIDSKKKGDENDDGDDFFPYPYIFKPPEPPDDLALAPRVQLHASPKKKETEGEIYCQYCGRELTKEEEITHSCKKKPRNKQIR